MIYTWEQYVAFVVRSGYHEWNDEQLIELARVYNMDIWCNPEPVWPMPEQGMPGYCMRQGRKLFVDLYEGRKGHTSRDTLRFVGFEQPLGKGVHFVVEDWESVFDQTCRWLFVGYDRLTRVTRTSYWSMFREPPSDIVRIDASQFKDLMRLRDQYIEKYGAGPTASDLLELMRRV